MTLLFSSNLYKHQKLLSIGLEPPLPALNKPLAPGIQEQPGFNWETMPGGLPAQARDATPIFPVIAFIGTMLVLLFLINHMYKAQTKPRRKKPRLKKLYNTGGRVPGV